MSLFNRPVRRTRTEIISILESALATGGDSAFDDFVSVPVADPEMESVRQQCLDVALAPTPVFEDTLKGLLAELRSPHTGTTA